jgi:DNA-binding FrmR family transcriptional regulator
MPSEGWRARVTPSDTTAELLQRLRSAHGHLGAVIDMAEAGEPCEVVLHQLGAVQAALRCAGRVLIQCQLEQSADSLLSDSPPETRAKTVLRLSKLYSIFIKTQANR